MFFFFILSKCHGNPKTLHFAPCLYPMKHFWEMLSLTKSAGARERDAFVVIVGLEGEWSADVFYDGIWSSKISALRIPKIGINF